jgi:regulatory protein
MAVVTKITDQKRNRNRRNIFLDGRFAFGCNLNVVAKFRLRAGMTIDPAQLKEIELGEVKQECFDAALQYLTQRLHSRSELIRKLGRREWGDSVINATLEELTRLGYIDDARFARTKTLSAAQHKHHGRRRAFLELIKSGVNGDIANRAVGEVYSDRDSLDIARELALKHAGRIRGLDSTVARRRLVGLLQRRGFEYETIKPVIDEVVGQNGSGNDGDEKHGQEE